MAYLQARFRINSKWQGRLLILAALYFTFVGGRRNLTELSLWPRIIHHLLMALLVGGWLLHLHRSRKFWPRTPLDVPIAVFFGINILATMFAVDPRVSVEELWRIGLQIVLFYMIVDLMRSKSPRAVFLPLFFAASVVILVSLFELLSWYAGIPRLPFFEISWLSIGGIQNLIPPAIYRLSFALLVSTLLSGYMAVVIPVGLAWFISTHAQDTRRGMALWLVCAVLVEILSFSRGGLLDLAISLSLFPLLLIRGSANWRARLESLVAQWRVRAAIGGLILLMVVGGGLWLRQQNLDGHRSGDVLRADLWRSALQIGLNRPALGVGRYGFGRAFREIRDPVISPDFFTTPDNYLLLIWAETGLPGVLSLGFLGITIMVAGLRTWRQSKGMEKIRVAGALAALCGYAGHNFFDAIATVTPILIPALVLAAYLVRDSIPGNAETRGLHKQWIPIAALVAVVLAQVGWIVSDAAQIHFQSAIKSMDNSNLETALNEINIARATDPPMGIYAAQKAQILGDIALTDNTYLPQALEAYADALRFEDSYDLMQANYGVLLAAAGEDEMAFDHLIQAQKIRPTEARYWLWVAALADLRDDPRLITTGYDRALELEPGWAVSGYWDETEMRTQARNRYLLSRGLSEVPLELLTEIPNGCWQLLEARMHGEPAAAYDFYCTAEITLHTSGDAAQAMISAQQAVTLQPDNGLFRATLAESYFAVGSMDSARREAETSIFLGNSRGYVVLGKIASEAGNVSEAESYFVKGGPTTIQWQGWDVAVYSRIGDLKLLTSAQFDAPGPTRYDFAAWLALWQLYVQDGRSIDAENVREAILVLDPYFVFTP